MTNTQLYLAIGIPLLFNGLLFLMLLTRVNHVETIFNVNFNLLVSKFMELDSRMSKIEAKLGIN